MSLKKTGPLKLNLGCGNNKITGYVNIDVEPSVKPDKVCNFLIEALPYEDSSVAEILLLHTIEHIRKDYHPRILSEIQRVLKSDGRVLIAYPEFLKCVENWKTNHRGKKTFWEHTIFGRQLYPSDFHVCIMDTAEFTKTLRNYGFKNISSRPEPDEPFNTIITAVKGQAKLRYENLVRDDMSTIKFERVGKKKCQQ